MRVCGVRNVRKSGNVGFTPVCDMLAMCGWRVRNYASAHAAPSGTLTFWQRFEGARPVQAIQVPAIQEVAVDGHPVSASRERRILLTNYIRGWLGSNTERKSRNGAGMRAGTPGKGF